MKIEALDGDRLAAWAGREPHPPYSCYPDCPIDSCREYRAEQLAAMAASPDHAAFEVTLDGVGRAAAGMTRLAWDTEQFGLPAGRLDYLILDPSDPDRAPKLAAAAARAVVDRADRLGVRHLSARFDSRDLPLVQAAESAGFQLVDAILKFSLDAADSRPAGLPGGVTLRDATPGDVDALAALAGTGFIYDRFHNDPSLADGVADRVHAAWVTNAVLGKTGAGVLVALVDGRPAGFFILALDKSAGIHFNGPVGTLVLITVDAAVRRRGVARALSQGAVAWLRERGAVRFEVGTQLANVPAANVYLKSGFRLVQTSLSLRRIAS